MGADDGDIGMQAHTDSEFITIMHQDEDGLEILVGGDGSSGGGTWVAVPQSLTSECFVVIFDDALSLLTNGQIDATVHRVRRAAKERLSLISFLALDGLLTPPECYGPRTQTDKQLERWYDGAVAVSGALL